MDRQRPRTDRHSSTRPDRDHQSSGSHEHVNAPTDGSRYDGHPAGRRHDRKFFHPSQYLGPDDREWYGPPDGRWYGPPKRGYLPPGGHERAGRKYLHPDDYSYGPGESEMGEEYAGDEYTGEEYSGDEYAGDEYAGEE